MKLDEILFDDEYGNSNFEIKTKKVLNLSNRPTMVIFLVEKKIVKNDKQANILLSIIILLMILLSIFIFKNSTSNTEKIIVIDKYGQEITFDKYVEMIKNGNDPLK